MIIAANDAEPANAFFLVAVICALVTVWMLVHAFIPKIRPNWCWEERSDGTPVSTVGYVAHAIAAALWAFAALAAGLHLAPIAGHGIWFVFSGFVIIVAAGLYDWAHTPDDSTPHA